MSIRQIDDTYVAHTYARFPVELQSGKGSLVWDANGKEYIDLGSGIAVNGFGISDEAWLTAVTEQLHVSGLDKDGEGGKLKLSGAVLAETVIDMLERADAKARNIRNDKLTAVIITGVQPLRQNVGAEADALIRDLRGVCTAEYGEPMVGKGYALAEIVGDHGGFPVMGCIVFGQGHHGRRLSRTEKAAEHRKFFHKSFSFRPDRRYELIKV